MFAKISYCNHSIHILNQVDSTNNEATHKSINFVIFIIQQKKDVIKSHKLLEKKIINQTKT